MGMDSNMLYEAFVRAIEDVQAALAHNPELLVDNPEVVVVLMENEGEEGEFKILGEIEAVMTLDDGRIGLVPSGKIMEEHLAREDAEKKKAGRQGK